eukprot:g15458.t1
MINQCRFVNYKSINYGRKAYLGKEHEDSHYQERGTHRDIEHDDFGSATFDPDSYGAYRRPGVLVLCMKRWNNTWEEALWDQTEAHRICEAAGWAPIPHPLCRLWPAGTVPTVNDRFYINREELKRVGKRIVDLHEGKDNLEALLKIAHHVDAVDKRGERMARKHKLRVELAEELGVSVEDLMPQALKQNMERRHLCGVGIPSRKRAPHKRRGAAFEDCSDVEGSMDSLYDGYDDSLGAGAANPNGGSIPKHSRPYGSGPPVFKKLEYEEGESVLTPELSASIANSKRATYDFGDDVKPTKLIVPSVYVKARYPPPQAVYFNVDLHPKHQFNLEMAMNVIESFIKQTEKRKPIIVIDRTTTIMKIFERRATRDSANRCQVQLEHLNNQMTNMWRHGTMNAKKWMDDLAMSLGERKAVSGMIPGFSKHGKSAHAGAICHSFTDDHKAYGYHDDAARLRSEKWSQVRTGLLKLLKEKAEERKRITKGKNIIGVVGYTNVGKSALINALMRTGGRYAQGQFAVGFDGVDACTGIVDVELPQGVGLHGMKPNRKETTLDSDVEVRLNLYGDAKNCTSSSSNSISGSTSASPPGCNSSVKTSKSHHSHRYHNKQEALGDAVEEKNMFFCTAETKLRRVRCNSEFAFLLDTVGVLKNLPLNLYSTFLATIEELRHCTVILHVQDVTTPGNQQFWEYHAMKMRPAAGPTMHDTTRLTLFKAGVANAFDMPEVELGSPKFGLGGLLPGERERFVGDVADGVRFSSTEKGTVVNVVSKSKKGQEGAAGCRRTAGDTTDTNSDISSRAVASSETWSSTSTTTPPNEDDEPGKDADDEGAWRDPLKDDSGVEDVRRDYLYSFAIHGREWKIKRDLKMFGKANKPEGAYPNSPWGESSAKAETKKAPATTASNVEEPASVEVDYVTGARKAKSSTTPSSDDATESDQQPLPAQQKPPRVIRLHATSTFRSGAGGYPAAPEPELVDSRTVVKKRNRPDPIYTNQSLQVARTLAWQQGGLAACNSPADEKDNSNEAFNYFKPGDDSKTSATASFSSSTADEEKGAKSSSSTEDEQEDAVDDDIPKNVDPWKLETAAERRHRIQMRNTWYNWADPIANRPLRDAIFGDWRDRDKALKHYQIDKSYIPIVEVWNKCDILRDRSIEESRNEFTWGDFDGAPVYGNDVTTNHVGKSRDEMEETGEVVDETRPGTMKPKNTQELYGDVFDGTGSKDLREKIAGMKHKLKIERAVKAAKSGSSSPEEKLVARAAIGKDAWESLPVLEAKLALEDGGKGAVAAIEAGGDSQETEVETKSKSSCSREQALLEPGAEQHVRNKNLSQASSRSSGGGGCWRTRQKASGLSYHETVQAHVEDRRRLPEANDSALSDSSSPEGTSSWRAAELAAGESSDDTGRYFGPGGRGSRKGSRFAQSSLYSAQMEPLLEQAAKLRISNRMPILTSARTGEGVEELREVLECLFKWRRRSEFFRKNMRERENYPHTAALAEEELLDKVDYRPPPGCFNENVHFGPEVKFVEEGVVEVEARKRIGGGAGGRKPAIVIDVAGAGGAARLRGATAVSGNATDTRPLPGADRKRVLLVGAQRTAPTRVDAGATLSAGGTVATNVRVVEKTNFLDFMRSIEQKDSSLFKSRVRVEGIRAALVTVGPREPGYTWARKQGALQQLLPDGTAQIWLDPMDFGQFLKIQQEVQSVNGYRRREEFAAAALKMIEDQ